MRALVWNNELEAVAQRWADQCTFGHDSVSIIMTMVMMRDLVVMIIFTTGLKSNQLDQNV